VGVCNVPITTKMHIIEGLEKATGKKIDPDHTELKTLGLNHLSWHRGFTVEGEDVWPQVIRDSFPSSKKNPSPSGNRARSKSCA
jgi:6-phospho-beta-glucosidase